VRSLRCLVLVKSRYATRCSRRSPCSFVLACSDRIILSASSRFIKARKSRSKHFLRRSSHRIGRKSARFPSLTRKENVDWHHASRTKNRYGRQRSRLIITVDLCPPDWTCVLSDSARACHRVRPKFYAAVVRAVGNRETKVDTREAARIPRT